MSLHSQSRTTTTKKRKTTTVTRTHARTRTHALHCMRLCKAVSVTCQFSCITQLYSVYVHCTEKPHLQLSTYMDVSNKTNTYCLSKFYRQLNLHVHIRLTNGSDHKRCQLRYGPSYKARKQRGNRIQTEPYNSIIMAKIETQRILNTNLP